MGKIKVQMEDMCRIRKLSALTLSPSGKKAAFLVTTGDLEANENRSDIWAYDPERTPSLFRLTCGGSGQAPQFEDENTLLFTGDRAKRHPAKEGHPNTVYNRISLCGGEAEEAFTLPFAVTKMKRLQNGLLLCGGRRSITAPDFSRMNEDEKAKARKELEEEKDYEVFDELPFWYDTRGIINKIRTGLFLCDTEKGTQTLLTDRLFDLTGFCVDEKEEFAAYWGKEFESLNPQMSKMYIRNLRTGEVTEMKLELKYAVDDALFLDGGLLFIANDKRKMGGQEFAQIYRAEPDGSIKRLAAPELYFSPIGTDASGSGSNWQGNDAYYSVAMIGYHSVYLRMNAAGEYKLIAQDPTVITAAAGPEEHCFLLGMEKDGLQELYLSENGRTTKLSVFNKQYAEEHEIAQLEHFSFTDEHGAEIDGWILRPADFDPAKTYPGILTAHGGPRSSYGEAFRHEEQFYAGQGYVVFYCNPRGSGGKGDDFADIFGERYGSWDFGDFMQFTDEVLKRVPQIDTARIGMTGTSYAGLMGNWIIGHTDRFAAVAVCGSIANYYSKILTTDIGYYHNIVQLGADPWKDPDTVWKHSPLAYVDRAKTPTLFIQGEQDYRCWMGDSIQMCSALLMHGVPSRYVLFHGESHTFAGIGKPKHRVRRVREIFSWFEKYLGPGTKA